MGELYGVIFFIYGICIGSFLNVVIYRVPLEKNIAKGRSYCPNCNKQLSAIELIPVVSWIIQGAKCKGCKNKISFIYPAIELITGILFLLAYLKYGLSVETFIYIIFWSMLLVIAIIDLKSKYIYDMTLVVTIVPIVILSLFTDTNIINQLISAVACFGVYFCIYKIAFRYYGQEAFGFGDVLLIGIVGYTVQLNLIYLTIFLPVYIALVFFVVALIYTKISNSKTKIDRKLEMPFGPAIALSAFILTYFNSQAESLLGLFF